MESSPRGGVLESAAARAAGEQPEPGHATAPATTTGTPASTRSRHLDCSSSVSPPSRSRPSSSALRQRARHSGAAGRQEARARITPVGTSARKSRRRRLVSPSRRLAVGSSCVGVRPSRHRGRAHEPRVLREPRRDGERRSELLRRRGSQGGAGGSQGEASARVRQRHPAARRPRGILGEGPGALLPASSCLSSLDPATSTTRRSSNEARKRRAWRNT